MKRLLTTIILSILSIITISTSIYAKNYEIIEVENNKEITFNTLVKLYEKADYTIYLNNKKLTEEVLDKESSLNNTYYYIGYTEDNEHFFEYFTKESETEKPTETTKETQVTTQKPKETTAKKETEKNETAKKEIAPAETQSKQPVQTTQVPQSSSTIQTQSGIKLDKNAWLSVYSNKIYSARELVKIIKNLSADTIVNISSVAQRQTFEYNVNNINEDILNELARREGKPNFKISPNASQDNCIYITITEYSQLN